MKLLSFLTFIWLTKAKISETFFLIVSLRDLLNTSDLIFFLFFLLFTFQLRNHQNIKYHFLLVSFFNDWTLCFLLFLILGSWLWKLGLMFRTFSNNHLYSLYRLDWKGWGYLTECSLYQWFSNEILILFDWSLCSWTNQRTIDNFFCLYFVFQLRSFLPLNHFSFWFFTNQKFY